MFCWGWPWRMLCFSRYMKEYLGKPNTGKRLFFYTKPMKGHVMFRRNINMTLETMGSLALVCLTLHCWMPPVDPSEKTHLRTWRILALSLDLDPICDTPGFFWIELNLLTHVWYLWVEGTEAANSCLLFTRELDCVQGRLECPKSTISNQLPVPHILITFLFHWWVEGKKGGWNLIKVGWAKYMPTPRNTCAQNEGTKYGQRSICSWYSKRVRKKGKGKDTAGNSGMDAGEGEWHPLPWQEPFVMKRPQLCDVAWAPLKSHMLYSTGQWPVSCTSIQKMERFLNLMNSIIYSWVSPSTVDTAMDMIIAILCGAGLFYLLTPFLKKLPVSPSESEMDITEVRRALVHME